MLIFSVIDDGISKNRTDGIIYFNNMKTQLII